MGAVKSIDKIKTGDFVKTGFRVIEFFGIRNAISKSTDRSS
jgi:hypothetical protein